MNDWGNGGGCRGGNPQVKGIAVFFVKNLSALPRVLINTKYSF